jgi:hypothetical protein
MNDPQFLLEWGAGYYLGQSFIAKFALNAGGLEDAFNQTNLCTVRRGKDSFHSRYGNISNTIKLGALPGERNTTMGSSNCTAYG